MDSIAVFSLSFTGSAADHNLIDFYDAAEALVGFERSLAITTHYVLNGSVITQAPSLKGATIYAVSPQAGSWKILAYIAAAGTLISQINAIPKDTPIGNLIYSAYDYIIHETLGFHVDYSKTLGVQLEEYRRQSKATAQITESGLDSVIEKCDTAIRQMHRPIVKSETATLGQISAISRVSHRMIGQLTTETYEYMRETIESDSPVKIRGRISSYDINTFKGRIFCFEQHRTIPFILEETARSNNAIRMITASLTENAASRASPRGNIEMTVFVNTSRTGTVKRYRVVAVNSVS